MLRSSKTITKEPMETAARFGRSSPDPGFGPVVELCRCHLHRSLDLISIGETLSSEGIATEETSPALLQIEPAGPFGNKDVLEARMILIPMRNAAVIPVPTTYNL